MRDVTFAVVSGSPATRWASIAFGAGVGIGSAYSECSLKFDESPSKLTSNVASTTLPEVSKTCNIVFYF